MRAWNLFDWICWVLLTAVLVLVMQKYVHAQTTTTTTFSPFHKKFISLCKTDTSVLKEPYKTNIRNLQIARGCP